MRYLPKIFIYFLLLFSSVLIILFFAAFLIQDKVTGIIINSLNKNISTRIETGGTRLSFIRSFPKATIVLKNVLVHSSPGFRSTDFPGFDTDTLLYAKTASLVLRPLDILKGRYNIENIVIKSGSCRFLCDKSGNVNYTISTGNSSQTPLTIDLEKIILSDISASYLNKSSDLDIWGIIESGNLRSRISGDDIDFTAKSGMVIDSFRLGGVNLNSHLQTSLDLKINSTKEGVSFRKSSIKIDNNDFTIEGTISSRDLCNLKISGNNIDLADLRHYLPKKFADISAEYDPSGTMAAECSITGLVTRKKNPHIDIKVGVGNGSIVYRQSKQKISNISFSGIFTNGNANKAETSFVSIDDLKFSMASSAYSGSLRLSDFVKPSTTIRLKGAVYPDRIRDFFRIKGFPVASGYADVDLSFHSDHLLKDIFTKDNIIDHLPEGTLNFNSFALGGTDEKTVFRQVHGSLSVSDRINAKDLTFIYRGHKLGVTGEIRNLAEWLAGRRVMLVADADVTLDNYSDPGAEATTERPAMAVNFPTDLNLNLRFRVDSIKYKSFSSTAVSGTVTYKPRLLTFKSLNMNTLDGFISGDGFIAGNANRTIISRGNFSLKNIDVKKAFTTFNNFGQQFIVAANLSGKLSGTVSVLMPMDSMFIPKPKNVTAEGRYTLMNGALVNFEPVKELSSFIELSELENIHFDKLENDFFIRNNVLFIPQMDVKSTAADLTVSGQHSFDNNYEYHVRMLLSELLSKKRKSVRKPVTEFGAVQDDGLGRTSILLKVVNKGDDVKVSYDLKAAGENIKNSIRNEKKNLKTILNEEYGSKQAGTTKPTSPQPSDRKRFNVTWEENDSVPLTPEKDQVREGGFRSLFRKK